MHGCIHRRDTERDRQIEFRKVKKETDLERQTERWTILGSSAVTAISTHIALHCLSCFDFFLLKFWYLYHKTILIILKTVKILFFYQLYFTLPLHPRTHVPQTTLLPPQTHSHMFLCFVLLLITAVNSRGYAKLHSHL